MSLNHPKSGPNNVGMYQMSGIPFVTSSVASEVPGPHADGVSTPVKVSFPYVTKFITVRNTGINELRVGFSADGVVAPGERRASIDVDKPANEGRQYFLIPSTGSADHSQAALSSESIQTFEVRCREIHFLSNAGEDNAPGDGEATSFSLFAGLTGILSTDFPVLTASNGFVGIG
jgi:hypothetical protein